LLFDCGLSLVDWFEIKVVHVGRAGVGNKDDVNKSAPLRGGEFQIYFLPFVGVRPGEVGLLFGDPDILMRR